MINNYNSLSWRMKTLLKNRESDGVGSPPDTAVSRTLQSWLTNLLLVVSFLTISSGLNAQVLIDPAGDGGFNNGTTFASNGWTVSNFASSSNQWVTGTAVTASPFSGRSAYISTDGGVTTGYNTGSSNRCYFYRDVAIPAGSVYIPLSFTWQGNGESSWDIMQVFIAPTTVTPTAGLHPGSGTAIIPTDLTGATQLGFFELALTTQTANLIIPSSFAGQTVRLIFMWKSDTSVGTNPPAGVDNISLSAFSAVPTFTATALGGLWSSPATWIGGLVPSSTSAVIPAGSIVTVDSVVSITSLDISGTVQWNGTANAMTVSGNVTINSGGSLLPYTIFSGGVALNVGGNFQNDGYTNFALGQLTFNGSGSTLSGTGIFQGNGTKGIIRGLAFNSLGSSTIATSQDLVTVFGLAHTAGSLNTNGKVALDNTAQVYGQSINTGVASVAVTAMGSSYSVAPVVFGAPVTQYADALAATLNTRYVSGNSVYLCTTGGTFNSTAPTSTDLQNTFTSSGPTLLYIGTVGTVGTNLPFNTALSTAVQYFHGNNVYQAITTAAITSAASMPVHTFDVVGNLRYLGTVAKVSPNWHAATQTLRSLTLTQTGSGFTNVPAIAFSIGAVGATGSGASATAVVFQRIAGIANSLLQKSGGSATISGGLIINSDQGTSLATGNPQASSGVGAVSTSNGGLNYTLAPIVGFAGPTALNLITNPGSGYLVQPTITVTGGNLVTGVALTTANFTITVNSGVVESVYLNGLTTATYSTPPTLTLTASPGVTATLAFPAGSWPSATATIGSNGQLTNFTVTNPGFGYVAAPTLGIGTTTGSANGGTFTTVATTPNALLGLYNLTLNFFAPSTAALVNADDAAIPTNRKLNNLALAGNGNGLNLTSGVTLYGTAPLTLAASLNSPGNILDLGTSNLNFTWNQYAGAIGTFGGSNAYIRNGSMSVTGRGGASTFNFPFAGSLTWFAGSTSAAVTSGSSVTRVTVSDTAAPTNATPGTGLATGTKAYRVQLGSGVTGLNPTVGLRFNSQDALTATQNSLFVAESASLSGAWTTRSASFSAAASALPVAGLLTTAIVAPGPIVPTADRYYAFATTFPTITSFSPLTVCANSGAFTIIGSNLTGVTSVTIGGTAVTSFTVVSATQINGIAGNGSDGVVAVFKGATSVSGTDFITVSPSSFAPTVSPTSASIILGGSPSITASGGAGVFNWYSAAIGGTLLFTGATYSAPICLTSSLFVAESNGTCEGPRTAVPVTVQPTVGIASPSSFCGVGSFTTTLSVTPVDPSITYTWSTTSGTATLLSTTGSTVSATVTEISDFTVVATGPGGCTASSVFTVSVFPLPTANVTTTANGVCPGTSATINSGLSAGNFSSLPIAHAPRTAPVTATTLVTGGVANVTLTSGSLDDGGWGSLPVGFNFSFFGTNYSTINIGTNGTLQFGTYNGAGLGDFIFTTLPSTTEPFNIVAVLAMDNNFTGATGGTLRYWTEGTAPNRRFVVSYQAVQEFGATNFSTSQAIFFETTGVIEVHVTSSTNVNRNKLVGVNNGNGTIGVLAYASGQVASVNPQNPITNPFGFRFSPPANFTTVWSANTGSGPVTIASGTNIFSQTVAPLVTTTYSISYTNQNTGCTNAPGSAQVLMTILGNVAPTGVTTLASATTICLGATTNLSLSYTGSLDGLTFQWQQNTGSGFTNILGATAATYTAAPTVVTDYQCIITSCGSAGGQSISAPITITYTNNILTSAGNGRCGSGPISFQATGNLGATINWYSAPTGGTLLFTGSPYPIAFATTSTTVYAAAETSGPICSSLRVAVTATVTTPATPLALSQSAVTVCSGVNSTSVTLTSGSGFYDSYTWSPATNVSGDEFAGWTFNLTASGTYTLTASQSGGLQCSAVASVVVTVQSANVATAVSTTPICLGTSTTISVSSLGITSGPQTAPTGYAASNATSPADEDIFNVTLGTLNNSSTCSTTGGAGSSINQYSNYTALTAPTLVAGVANPLSIQIGTCLDNYTNYTNVYIDYNRNGVFEVTEQAFTEGVGVIGPHTISGSITVPLSASAGVTRMRVFVVEFGNSTNSPEATYTWGETEDYNVNIIGVGDATASYTYSWSPGGATTASVSVTPATSGTNTYTVTATSPEGCITTGTIDVIVNTDPVDSISGGAAAMCLGLGTIDFDSTTGVTWSSSNEAVATVDANGVVTALTAGSTTIGAFIFNPTTGCTTFAVNPQSLTVYAPLAIILQPTPASVLPSTVATFTITATGSIVSYQWQVSPNNSTWSNLANDATYSNVTTNTLSVNADTPLNGLYYRCVITGNSPCATPLESISGQLSVNDLAITDDPDATTLCVTGSGSATFNVTFDGDTPDQIVWEYFDLTDWVVLDGNETTLGSVTYTGETTTSLTLNGLSIVNNGWKVRVNGVITSPSVIVTSAEALITVNTPATISLNPGNVSACYSGAVSNFSVTSTGGSGFQWQYATSPTGPWSNVVNLTPLGATYSGATSATLAVTTTSAIPAVGMYFYQVVVTSPANCADAISTPAQLVIKTPTITVTPSSGLICSPGTPVTLTASGVGSSGTYTWSSQLGLSAYTGDVVTANPATTTTYTVTGTDVTGCSNTATVTISVAPALAPTATATPGIVCSGTNAQLLATSGFNDEGIPSIYCIPTVGFVGETSDNITNFTFAGINNSTGDGPGDYNFYTSPSATVAAGTPTTFSITPNPLFGQQFRIWIDFNKNGVFEASESVFSTTASTTTTVSGSITVPTTAINGVTRMRVGDKFSTSVLATEACGHTGYGEYEDYNVTITGATNSATYTYSWSPSTFLSATNIANPIATAVTTTTIYTVSVTSSSGCTANQQVTVTVADGIAITTQPANAAFCPGTTASLSVVATGAGLTYQWRKDGNIILANASAVTPTLLLPLVTLADSGSYDVVINTICGGPATTSSAATLTINPTPVATNPGPQTACIGSTVAIPLSGTPSGVTFNISGGAAIGLANQTGVLAIPSFTALAGTATISVTPVANTCTGAPITFTFTVNETPSAVVLTPSSPTIGCLDGPVLLSASGGTVAPSAYCIPTVGFVGATSDNITNFTFAGINNTTGDGPGDYNAYLSPSAVVTAGTATPFSITPNPAFGQNFRVWVDMNQNGVFEATESVFDTSVSSTITVSGNITIPTTAFNGSTRLRIADQFAGTGILATQACGHTGFGEFEDYTVLISGATPAPTPLYVWTSTGGGLFTNAAGTLPYTGTPSAIVYADPAATATVSATSTVAGCSSTGSTTVTVTVCESVVNLKLFIEGYYDGSGTMKPVKNNQNFVSPTTHVADITVELYDAGTLTLVTSTSALLLTDGTAVCTFPTAPSGSFYLTVKGSNFIQTWSANPVIVGSTPLTYDFSNAANKAYGDNMALLETGVYGLFSGELDGDGNIDNADYSLWETDANNFESGVFPTDLNGDGNVDNGDYSIWEANANNFVFSVTPTP